MQKRGAVELSMGIIVIIIISLALLIGGIGFLFKFIDKSEQTQQIIEQDKAQKERQLEESFKSVAPEEEEAVEIIEEKLPEKQKPCEEDLSCDHYFLYLPIGTWKSEAKFKQAVEHRSTFFNYVTSFKFKKTGTISIPIEFSNSCKLGKINQHSAPHYLKMKSCADKYADKLGIDYDRVVGLSNTFEGGRTFFNGKSVFASLGYKLGGGELSDRPGITLHELGHSYNLCDEYSYIEHNKQGRTIKYASCANTFPQECNKQTKECLGNTPTYRDYQGSLEIPNTCGGDTFYSVMGFSVGRECGFDKTGGYEAIK